MAIFTKAALGSIKSAWKNAPRAAQWGLAGAGAGVAAATLTDNNKFAGAGLGAAGALAFGGRKELASTLRSEGSKLGEAYRGAKWAYSNPSRGYYGHKDTPWG